jgi:hypothetical protein
MFFEFLLNRKLCALEAVEVTTKVGSWTLHDTLVFVLDSDTRIQLLIDVNTQETKGFEKTDVTILGYYEDLLSIKLVRLAASGVVLPSKVIATTEFQASIDKLVGCEIELASGGFALILHPEDVEVRDSGSVWQYCREFAVPQLGRITITRVAGMNPSLKI